MGGRDQGQLVAPADHADFYAPASSIVPTLHLLQDLANVLRRQVAGYDDTRQVDPVVRLAEAAEHLALLRDALTGAQRQANLFWSSISHVGVKVQPS